MANDNQGSPKKNTNDRIGWKVKEPKVFANKTKATGRVDLSPDSFDKLVKEKGVRVKIYRSMYCPNVKSIDGAEHNIDCKVCSGDGFLDVYPLETLAFIQAQDYKSSPLANGNVDGNSVLATFLTGIELQYYTKIELCDFTEIFFQHVKRQRETNIDVLKYKAIRVNALIDSNGKTYHEGIDFCLDINGNIKWHNNKGPFPDQVYSIHYEAQVMFRAIKASHVNRFTQIATKSGEVHLKLPEQWLLQKDFLVKRLDGNGNEILPNTILDSDPEDS